MSRWIHGRQGRPIASIAAVLMLVSLLVPLAPPPVQAQLSDSAAAFFGAGSITEPTPIVVLDFDDRSGYRTGMLGRVFTDALAVELLNLKSVTKFEVAKRADVERVLAESNLTVPMSYTSQAMVADRLDCKYTFSGEIKDVRVFKKPEGTYAEVTVQTVVIHKTMKAPINGAVITQLSSPKIGYSGNTDVLVQEALATAAYRTAQTLLDNRLPIGTILMSPHNGEVLMKGGSTIGFRPGMTLVTMRRDSVTGRLRIINTTPTDSTCIILEEGTGIAAGDKSVPIFEFFAVSPRIKKERFDKAGLQIAGVGLLGALATLVGTQGGDSHMLTVSAPTVRPMADAYPRHSRGANYLTWNSFGSKAVCILIYRDDNIYAPIAVLPGNATYYIDTANYLEDQFDMMESLVYDINIDEDTGLLEDGVVPTEDLGDILNLDDWTVADIELEDDHFAVTTRRRPVKPGDTIRYMLRVVFVEYKQGDLSEEELGHPDTYVLRLGDIGAMSVPVVVTQPPLLDSPTDTVVPVDGFWTCRRVPSASQYMLQLSADDSTFSPATTVEITAPVVIGDTFVTVEYLLSQIYNNPKLQFARVIWWRMGARVTGFPMPAGALGIANMNNWVFSPVSHFDLPAVPPPGSRTRGVPGMMSMPGMEKGNVGRPTGRDGIFRR